MNAQDKVFREWMKAHVGLLVHVARAFADPADQNDLLQELMLAVWKAVPAFRAESSPVTFIHRVAHNRALTWRRRENWLFRRARQGQADLALFSGNGADPGGQERVDRLYAAIRTLSSVDRSLMLLSLENVSYGEMAAMHGISTTNVGVRLSRARQRVTTLLREEPGHE
ncbi:RNA polymerase sigma factor [Niveispirillum fermenti]|uniref:RNA polymerase sigma factor n=1 Tax=Niveispirillum fermenti TaxID=1233113 RepID=UPI003A8C6574